MIPWCFSISERVTLTYVYIINFVFHKNNYGNVIIIIIFCHVKELPTDSFYFYLLTEEGRLANNVKNISNKRKKWSCEERK